MDPSERIETDSLVNLQVPITEGDISTNVEAVGELQEDRSVAGSGDGMPPEAEVRRNEPPRGCSWCKRTLRAGHREWPGRRTF